jgi:hypothetical protein
MDAESEEIDRARLASISDQISANDKTLEQERERLKIATEFNQRKRELTEQIMKAELQSDKESLKVERDKLDASEKQTQAYRVRDALEGAAVGAMKALVEGGDRQARVALAQFDIRKKFREMQQQLEGLLNDPTATADQKASAGKILGGLGNEEQWALNKAGTAGVRLDPFAQTQQNQGGITGVGAAAQENALFWGESSPLVRAEKEQLQTLKDILAKIGGQSPGGQAGIGPDDTGAPPPAPPFGNFIPNDQSPGIFGAPGGFANPFGGDFGQGAPGSGLSPTSSPFQFGDPFGDGGKPATSGNTLSLKSGGSASGTGAEILMVLKEMLKEMQGAQSLFDGHN